MKFLQVILDFSELQAVFLAIVQSLKNCAFVLSLSVHCVTRDLIFNLFPFKIACLRSKSHIYATDATLYIFFAVGY